MSVTEDTQKLQTILELLPNSPLTVSLNCGLQLGWIGWNTHSHIVQVIGQEVRHSAKPLVTPPSKVRTESKIKNQQERVTHSVSCTLVPEFYKPPLNSNTKPLLFLSQTSVFPESCLPLSLVP